MIHDYAEKNNILYRLDQSNESDDYLRNRIRHYINPIIKNENPKFIYNFSRTLNKLQQTENLYKKYISDNYQIDNNTISLDELPEDSFELILFELLKPYQITWTQVENIRRAMHHSGKLFHTPKFTLLIDRTRLIVNDKSRIDYKKIAIEGLGCHDLGSFGQLDISVIKAYHTDPNPTCEFMDADHLVWPLTVRSWEEGDRFSPIGLKGKTQKLQDYFSNNKINRLDKAKIPILTDSHKIVWIMGHRLSDTVKITKSTKRIIRFNYTAVPLD